MAGMLYEPGLIEHASHDQTGLIEHTEPNYYTCSYVVTITYHILDLIHQAVPHEAFFDPVECASSAHVPGGGVNVACQQDLPLFFFAHNIT